MAVVYHPCKALSGHSGFSYTWVTISVPIGCALMLLSVIGRIQLFLRAIREGAPIRKEEDPTEVI
jgi:hypothetical protein